MLPLSAVLGVSLGRERFPRRDRGHLRGRRGQPRSRGPDGAREPHLRGGSDQDDPPRRTRPAAQRHRVARGCGHHLHRQDRHPDGVLAAGGRRAAGARSRRGRRSHEPSGPTRPARRRAMERSMRSHASYSGSPANVEAEVPFSSGRRWSALQLDGHAVVLGAPELLPLGELGERVAAEQQTGQESPRACTRWQPSRSNSDDPQLPDDRCRSASSSSPSSCDRMRARPWSSSAREGIELKVLSGDAPHTVAAIAATPASRSPGRRADGTAPRRRPAALEAAPGAPSSGGSPPRASARRRRRCATAAATSPCSATG